ncbi:multicopper oxidase 2A [Dacryopinax primogenitus]|uniref:Multicopper oxidase 2A n=1 Tax=Dacryopinax primogenitus (strain DJM 731) TaxID=1858805 RepID=M5G7I8_DACPD|nr:multicopper oxidase 2A [Dacryopinax primogenitus]EJT99732.1 multicopper oxidase 2A [Dacryopinax primogenitus]
MADTANVEKDSIEVLPKGPTGAPRRRYRVYFLGGALLVVIVLGLALGLGLGLGLKNRNFNSGFASGSGNSTVTYNVTVPTADNFLLPDIRNDPPQVRYFSLVVSESYGAPDTFARPMLVVNGTYPGPTLLANQNDRLIITVYNQLPNVSTAIHWHGLYQNTTPFYDGTHGISQCGIPPGQSLVYNFTLNGWTGTTWYHSHYQTQYTDGVLGAIVINPSNATVDADGRPANNPPQPANPVQWDADFVVIIQDWYHTPSQAVLALYLGPNGPDGTAGDEPTPESGTINGQGQWYGGPYANFALQAGKTYRFRLINSGSLANVRFSIDDHPLTIVSADGVDTEPLEVAGVQIAVAQRYDVLVHTNQTTGGQWWMRGTVLTDMFTYSVNDAQYDHRAILSYPVADPSSSPQPGSADPGPGVAGLQDLSTTDWFSLVPAVRQTIPEPDFQYPLEISFSVYEDTNYYGYMNSTSWVPLEGESTLTLLSTSRFISALVNGPSIPQGQLIVTTTSVQTVDLLITNLDDGDHPFHLHGHRPWLLAAGDGRYAGQALNTTDTVLMRDTHVIAHFGYAVLRFVTDNPGMWAFHCHIAWHMGAGLLMQIASQPQVALSYGMPQEILAQCAG